jgi:hypothetical protein
MTLTETFQGISSAYKAFANIKILAVHTLVIDVYAYGAGVLYGGNYGCFASYAIYTRSIV